MKKIVLKSLVVAILLLFSAGNAVAEANLIGYTIAGRLDWNNQGYNGFNSDIYDSTPTITTVVGPGVEFSYPTANVTYSADFGSNTLTISYTSQY
jgi:hypothetical protein